MEVATLRRSGAPETAGRATSCVRTPSDGAADSDGTQRMRLSFCHRLVWARPGLAKAGLVKTAPVSRR